MPSVNPASLGCIPLHFNGVNFAAFNFCELHHQRCLTSEVLKKLSPSGNVVFKCWKNIANPLAVSVSLFHFFCKIGVLQKIGAFSKTTMHNHAGLNASLTCSSTVNFSKSNMRSSSTSQLVKHSNIHVLVYRINASIYHDIKIRFFQQ